MSITAEGTKALQRPREQSGDYLAPGLSERDSRIAFSTGYLSVRGYIDIEPQVKALDPVGLELLYEIALHGQMIAKEDLTYLFEQSTDPIVAADL